jgi:hypothetical protein
MISANEEKTIVLEMSNVSQKYSFQSDGAIKRDQRVVLVYWGLGKKM